MAFKWEDRIDDEDYNLAEDINSLAHGIIAEEKAREQADNNLQTQINNIQSYSSRDDLYGTKKVERTAGLEIIWNDEPFPDEIDTSILNEKIDLSGNIGDIFIRVDETMIFPPEYSISEENFNGEITVGDTSDSQYITMFYDRNIGKCWLENTHTAQEDKYENGVYSFDMGYINAEYRYNDDWQELGKSPYTLLISYNLYGNPQYETSFKYADYPDILSLEGGDTFLEAVNKNTENINSIPKITVDTALSNTSDNPVQNKVITSKLTDIAEEIAGIKTGSKKTATFVIGTTTKGHTAEEVDYLCDGEADNVEINAAIAALPSDGGKIILLEGTYSIKAQIKIQKPNVTIEGMGAGTTLEVAENITDSQLLNVSGNFCILRDFSMHCYGYDKSVTGIRMGASWGDVERIVVGEATTGIRLINSSNVKCMGIIIQDSQNGIICTGNISRNITIENVLCNYIDDVGISISSGCSYCDVSNNYFEDFKTAIKMSGTYCSIKDNICHEQNYSEEDEYSIYVDGTFSQIFNNITPGKEIVVEGDTNELGNNMF